MTRVHAGNCDHTSNGNFLRSGDIVNPVFTIYSNQLYAVGGNGEISGFPVALFYLHHKAEIATLFYSKAGASNRNDGITA